MNFKIQTRRLLLFYLNPPKGEIFAFALLLSLIILKEFKIEFQVSLYVESSLFYFSGPGSSANPVIAT